MLRAQAEPLNPSFNICTNGKKALPLKFMGQQHKIMELITRHLKFFFGCDENNPIKPDVVMHTLIPVVRRQRQEELYEFEASSV